MLVLPVEERNEDSFPGGMAGGVPAPLDEVDANAHKEVNSGRYDVVWDAIERKYVCCGDRVTVVEDLGGQHGLPGEGAAGVNQVGDPSSTRRSYRNKKCHESRIEILNSL